MLSYFAASYHARRAPSFKSTPSSNNCKACGARRSLALGFTGALRPVKGAFLQALGQHADTGAVEVKQFDPIAPPVAEDKERAALGILPQAFLRGRPQAVEVGAQVAGRGGDKDLEVRVETQHEARALKQ